jgi:hypothetical protein
MPPQQKQNANTSGATSWQQHLIDNALEQDRQFKCVTTLDQLSRIDKALTLPTVQLQFSCAVGRILWLQSGHMYRSWGYAMSSKYVSSNILDRAQQRYGSSDRVCGKQRLGTFSLASRHLRSIVREHA